MATDDPVNEVTTDGIGDEADIDWDAYHGITAPPPAPQTWEAYHGLPEVIVPPCTGLAAVWCPRCGSCACPPGSRENGSLNAPGCPLHSPASDHAE